MHLQWSLQLERREFCVQECSLSIKSALSFTAVALREISSTAALMKLLLPIEIHVAVCELQATHRPIIAGLLLQNCAIQVSLLGGVWNSGVSPAGVYRGAAIGFWKNSIQNNVQQLLVISELLYWMKFTGGHFATCRTPVSCLYRERPEQGPVTALSGPRGLSNPAMHPIRVYVERKRDICNRLPKKLQNKGRPDAGSSRQLWLVNYGERTSTSTLALIFSSFSIESVCPHSFAVFFRQSGQHVVEFPPKPFDYACRSPL